MDSRHDQPGRRPIRAAQPGIQHEHDRAPAATHRDVHSESEGGQRDASAIPAFDEFARPATIPFRRLTSTKPSMAAARRWDITPTWTSAGRSRTTPPPPRRRTRCASACGCARKAKRNTSPMNFGGSFTFAGGIAPMLDAGQPAGSGPVGLRQRRTSHRCRPAASRSLRSSGTGVPCSSTAWDSRRRRCCPWAAAPTLFTLNAGNALADVRPDGHRRFHPGRLADAAEPDSQPGNALRNADEHPRLAGLRAAHRRGVGPGRARRHGSPRRSSAAVPASSTRALTIAMRWMSRASMASSSRATALSIRRSIT